MNLCYTTSCLLLISILTSFVKSSTDFNKLKKSEDLLMIFSPSNSSDPSPESIIEEVHKLEPNVTYYVRIQDIPPWSQFIVMQAHVYLHNVTLSYNIEKTTNKFVSGQNIGLVQNVTTAGTAQFYLENSNPFNVSVLLAVIPYSKHAPIPGGCNMEFEVETSPWLRVNVTGALVTVTSQPARSPLTWGLAEACQLPSPHYQAYHLYLPEKDFFMSTYFTFIQMMLTPERINKNGRKVLDSVGGGSMRHMYSAYHGTGSVYALVASAGPLQYTAYVPAVTYSCNPAQYTDSCQVLTSTFSRSLCALVLFVGLFVCLYGHSFFQTELFLMSTLVGSIITYVIIAPNKLSDSTNVLLSTVGGVTVGNIWLVFWWACGSPMVSIAVATLILGWLLTSITFYTVLADLPYWESDANYWLVFVCGLCVVAALFSPQTNRVNILACCTVGAYAAIVPIDDYVGANLKYIFINSIRRATVPGFNEAVIDPPFQMRDMTLAGLWVVLAVTGYVMQSLRFGDRPAFPRSTHPWHHSPAPYTPTTPRHSENRPLLYDYTASPGSDSVFS